MFGSLHHMAISVRDLDRSIAFYSKLFGMSEDTRVISDDGLKTIVHLRRDDWYIEMFCHNSPFDLPEHAGDIDLDFQTIGVKHGGFHADDMEAARTHAIDVAGADSVSAVRSAKYYEFFFVRDPDGAVVEFVRRKSQAAPAQA